MNILYDYQIFEMQKYGGISRYFVELAQHYNDEEDINVSIAAKITNNEYLVNSHIKNNLVLHSKYVIKKRHYIESKVNRVYLRHAFSMRKIDVFHPTYYDPYFLKYIGEIPFVLTIYDMIHEKFSEMFSPNDRTSQNKKLLAEKASKIIAISESTKQDIIDILGIDEAKIDVVYLGSSLPLASNTITIDSCPSKYILFVGNRTIYKNFNRFIKAIAPLLHEDKELHVVCAGGGKFHEDEEQLLSQLEITKRVHQFNIDDTTLTTFYSEAIMFVFPSMYEGFGIPILEAFECNCPLVCSNISSLPEVAGDAAVYFNPMDESSILTAVRTVFEDSQLQKKLVDAGQERLKLFSWKKTAEETKKVYKSII